jgi:hypothetical protein
LPFGPGDFTAGFQWTTVSIPAGAQQTGGPRRQRCRSLRQPRDRGVRVAARTIGQTLTYGHGHERGSRCGTRRPGDGRVPGRPDERLLDLRPSAGSSCASASGTAHIEPRSTSWRQGRPRSRWRPPLSGGDGAISNTATVAPAGGLRSRPKRQRGHGHRYADGRVVHGLPAGSSTRARPRVPSGPALLAGASRTFPLTGNCVVPANATASLLERHPRPGRRRRIPAGLADRSPVPTVSAINYAPGQTRANSRVYALSPGGDGRPLRAGVGRGADHRRLRVLHRIGARGSIRRAPGATG